MPRVDLHLHTGRYSQCAECLDPLAIEGNAVRAGVDGVLLTEHDMFWQDEEAELLRRRSPRVRIFRGIEVSARGCHLVVVGMDEVGPLLRGVSLEEVAAFARPRGAAVVLAHPYRNGPLRALPLGLVDAVEVWSTSFTREEARAARRLARRLGKPQVAGSDAHAPSHVGFAWTELPRLPADELELAAAIRSGLGRPSRPARRRPGQVEVRAP
jgi:predicted metal-dependent phosphoesterase TrpH